MVEEGIREQGEQLEEAEQRDPAVGQAADARAIAVKSRVRLPSGGTGEVLELRGDGTAVVLDAALLPSLPAGSGGGREKRGTPAGAQSPARESAPAALEVDLRGLTGDEAEQAAIAAMDAAVLAEQPFLRIIHGMGTGVVRDRVRRVVSGDRRVTRFGFAPRNQGGTGVTIVEFTA